jgi:hypothetical protein
MGRIRIQGVRSMVLCFDESVEARLGDPGTARNGAFVSKGDTALENKQRHEISNDVNE